MNDRNFTEAQIQARWSLAQSARKLRSLRGSDVEKELNWQKDKYGNLFALVGSGRIILEVDYSKDKKGVSFTSSFGANSEDSFSGYMPGLTMEEAEKLAYYSARKGWEYDKKIK
jgi:hypothetical protein